MDGMSLNRIMSMKKPHIARSGGRWHCGIFMDCVGDTPALAFAAWVKANGGFR
jgi:hypothetical protein